MADEKVLDPRPDNLDLFDKPLIILTDVEELDASIHIEVLRRLGEKSALKLRKEIEKGRFTYGSALLLKEEKGTVIYTYMAGNRVSKNSLSKALTLVDEVLGEESAYLVYPARVNRRELTLLIRESDAPIDIYLVRDRIENIFA